MIGLLLTLGGGVAVILIVAGLCDRYGHRATPPASTPLPDATREITAIRASWDELREHGDAEDDVACRRSLPPPPYRMPTNTAPQAVIRVQTPGRHRAAV